LIPEENTGNSLYLKVVRACVSVPDFSLAGLFHGDS
jgi:hypothetical protein